MSTVRIACAFILLLALAPGAAAQSKTTGSLKGKVRVDSNSTPEGVTVTIRQGEREAAVTRTNAKGEFVVHGLDPGVYGLTLRKPGLSIRSMEQIEVKAGKVRSVGDKLFLPIDQGSLAFVRGSVFNAEGRSVRGARVELALIQPDGSTKKIDGRISNEVGFFVFRLTPERARYRITVKADGMQTATQDVEVEGASRNNIAITLNPAAN